MTTPTPDATTSAAAFAAKWRVSARREAGAAQEHFIDLCRLVGAARRMRGTWRMAAEPA